MKQIHSHEKEQFRQLFQEEGVDRVTDRFNVLDAFLSTEKHVTVMEICEILKQQGFDFTEDFVRETIKLMHTFGFAHKSNFDNGIVRYEHRHLGDHHDHMVCVKCRTILEFSDDRLESMQKTIADEYGFHMLQHKMEIYGLCSDCLASRVSILPLTAAKQGERLAIHNLIGGAGLRNRLLTLGLKIGDSIEVVTNDGLGQVIVAVGFNRISLGRGLAGKVQVTPQDAIKQNAQLTDQKKPKPKRKFLGFKKFGRKRSE